MSDAVSWLLAAGLVVIFELFTGTFYLLMIGLGLAIGGIAALAGLGAPWPSAIAATVGVLATLLLRRNKRPQTDAARDPNANLDIGQSVTVLHWQDGAARVMYRGALWDVELAPGNDPLAGIFTIREMRGSCLIVVPFIESNPDN